MRTTAKFFFTLLMLSTALLYSCDTISMDEESNVAPSKQTDVKIITRAADGTSQAYPIHVFAFKANGSLFTQQTINSGEESMLLHLAQNTQYHLVVVSGDATAFSLPASPTLSSFIKLKEGKGYTAAAALQMGFADISTTTNAATAHIQMNYVMTSLNVNLSGMPSNYSNVKIKVSSLYESVNLSGAYEGQTSAEIPCRKTADGTWVSDVAYMFPSATERTVFTISYTTPEGESIASATYQAKLNAGTPYSINARYADDSIQMTGSITPPAWSNTVNLDFNFGNDTNTTINANGTTPDIGEDTENMSVKEIPAPMSVWNGHIVFAHLDADGKYTTEVAGGSQATLLLLSLNDWDDITSAFHASSPNAASDIARSYSEYGIAGWRIPSEFDARMLYNIYSDNADTMMALFKEAQCSPVFLLQDSKNVRYLCDEARKTYSYRVNSVLDAGATVKYHLRLIKTINVSIQKTR